VLSPVSIDSRPFCSDEGFDLMAAASNDFIGSSEVPFLYLGLDELSGDSLPLVPFVFLSPASLFSLSLFVFSVSFEALSPSS